MHKTKEQRQFDAIIRQMERDARTPTHQLARLRIRDHKAGRGGKSEAETAQLLDRRALERAIL